MKPSLFILKCIFTINPIVQLKLTWYHSDSWKLSAKEITSPECLNAVWYIDKIDKSNGSFMPFQSDKTTRIHLIIFLQSSILSLTRALLNCILSLLKVLKRREELNRKKRRNCSLIECSCNPQILYPEDFLINSSFDSFSRAFT